MQRATVYVVCALAVALAIWLVLLSRQPQSPAGEPAAATQAIGDLPVRSSSAAPGGASAAGHASAGATGGAAAAPSAGASPGDAGPRRVALPAADAQSLAAGATTSSGASGSAGTGATGAGSGSGATAGGGTTTSPNPVNAQDLQALRNLPVPPPLGVLTNKSPGASAASPTSRPPEDDVSDPTDLPRGTPDPHGEENLQPLTTDQIWERVQQQCPDCTPEQQQALYLDIERKSKDAAGWAR